MARFFFADDPKHSLNRKFGYPQVYYQFLANVVKTGHQERIVPIPISSTIGCRILQKRQIAAELIYIDGSHEYPDCFDDMNMFSCLLSEHGVIFGDDYTDHWPQVKYSVQRFQNLAKNMTFSEDGKFWRFTK